MDDRNVLNTQETFTRAVQFIWREAEMLDRREYNAWLDLWDPQGYYVVPIDPNTTDFAATLNYAYDDHHMREMRVQRMTSGYSASASDAADTVEVKSSQIVVAYKRGANTIFAADLTYRISFASGEPKLQQKVIRLIDSTEALSAVGFLL